jgi:hypothetical protein
MRSSRRAAEPGASSAHLRDELAAPRGAPGHAPRRLRALALCAAAQALALACACASPLPHLSLPGTRGPTISEEELRGKVIEAASRFTIAVASTADTIAQQSPDRAVRRRAVLWKVRITPLIQKASLAPAPAEGLLELLLLATAQRQYLTEGSGNLLFEEQQALAQARASELEAEISEVSRALLDDRQAASLHEQVDQLARRYPIRGEFMVETAQGSLSELDRSDALQWVLRVPLAPLRALEGVESGALAIRELNATARQFNELLAGLPQQSRWQLELLLYDFEDRESTLRALASLETVASSAERFSIAAERLPQAMREELAQLLRESQSAQHELGELLRSLHASVTGSGQLLSDAAPLLGPLERTAAALQGAGIAWDQVVRDVRAEGTASEAQSAAAAARPFDVLEYERTALQTGAAALQLRELLAELPTHSRARSWVDLLVGRALALLAGAFGLHLLYRIALSRMAGERTGRRSRRRSADAGDASDPLAARPRDSAA